MLDNMLGLTVTSDNAPFNKTTTLITSLLCHSSFKWKSLALVVLENKQIAEDVLTHSQQLLDETTQQFSQSEDSSYEEDVIQQHIFRAFDSSRSILSFSSHFRCQMSIGRRGP
jgi:hypothetical protein